jgi:hypothetical protein
MGKGFGRGAGGLEARMQLGGSDQKGGVEYMAQGAGGWRVAAVWLQGLRRWCGRGTPHTLCFAPALAATRRDVRTGTSAQSVCACGGFCVGGGCVHRRALSVSTHTPRTNPLWAQLLLSAPNLPFSAAPVAPQIHLPPPHSCQLRCCSPIPPPFPQPPPCAGVALQGGQPICRRPPRRLRHPISPTPRRPALLRRRARLCALRAHRGRPVAPHPMVGAMPARVCARIPMREVGRPLRGGSPVAPARRISPMGNASAYSAAPTPDSRCSHTRLLPFVTRIRR